LPGIIGFLALPARLRRMFRPAGRIGPIAPPALPGPIAHSPAALRTAGAPRSKAPAPAGLNILPLSW